MAVSTLWGVVSHLEGIMAEHGSSCLCLPADIFKETWCSLYTSKMYTFRNCVQRTPWLKQIWRILPLCDDRWQRHVWARLDMFGHVCLDLNCCQGEPLTWVGMLTSLTWLCQVWYLTWCQEEPLTWVGMLISFAWLCQVWYLTWCQGEQLTWVGMLISFTWLCQVWCLTCCLGEPLTWFGMFTSFAWSCQTWYLTCCQGERWHDLFAIGHLFCLPGDELAFLLDGRRGGLADRCVSPL